MIKLTPSIVLLWCSIFSGGDLGFRGLGVQLLHERDEPAANGIADRNRDKRLEHRH